MTDSEELEADLGIPKLLCRGFDTASYVICVMGAFVLWLQLPEQKQHCAAVANDLIQTATNEQDS